jgi:two-component system, OmpR family, KDP operon response regulator KdpE
MRRQACQFQAAVLLSPTKVVTVQSMSTDVVLVIDDEAPIRRVVRNAVEAGIGRVLEAATGQQGIDMAAAERPQLVILDLGLSDIEGSAVCREIRSWSSMPIIVLSARQSPQEQAALLDAGADDYITKPFSTIELQARMRAALRRSRVVPFATATAAVTIGNVSIDFAKPAMTRDTIAVHLTKTEWQLLRTLARHSGRTMTHRQIFSEVWGKSFGDAQQNLRVHIRSLRRKIEVDPVRPQIIITEPGVGYRFEGSP